jgi:FlaA1/EpsC-like NDP-sugar epimerase
LPGRAEEYQVIPSSKPTYNFSPDATYVIGGGSGGLGRFIISWMITRGARNLLLLSRSGTSSSPVSELITLMKIKGVRIEAPMCDISDEETLVSVLGKYKHMPPIKGCIQASMVLQVFLFPSPLFCSL